MCTVSFPKVLNITIHNLHPSLKLTSPVYSSNSIIRHMLPNQQIDTGAIMEAIFVIDSGQKRFKSVLLYKLQRKYANRDDNYPNDSVASIEDAATNIYFLVVWDTDCEHEFCVCLIECIAKFTWDEYKLWAWHDQHSYRFSKDYNYKIITWLIHGNVVMKVRSDITYGLDYKLDIVISEGTGYYKNMKYPMKIDSERSVQHRKC
jgi:hypothetical protein